jgi:hypothetical protein
LTLLVGSALFLASGVFNKPKDNVVANDFIFFGHTDYGGDGGEGSFIYPENQVRYDRALTQWCEKNNIVNPKQKDINKFQREEAIKFITHSPFAWIRLQATKFFRTFGVVPESNSFLVLYTGLLKEKLWLTAIFVVAPVALIILMFISLFSYTSLEKLANTSIINHIFSQEYKTRQTADQTDYKKHFLYFFIIIFLYYIIATIFFGQYQERYRLSIMTIFIIPILGYFVVNFNKTQFFKKTSLIIKGIILMLLLTIWTFQAVNAISNETRLTKAIERVKGTEK